jgi:hypothetical protein
MKMNGTQQLLTYAEYINLLEDEHRHHKENTGTLIDASKEVDLGVN